MYTNVGGLLAAKKLDFRLVVNGDWAIASCKYRSLTKQSRFFWRYLFLKMHNVCSDLFFAPSLTNQRALVLVLV